MSGAPASEKTSIFSRRSARTKTAFDWSIYSRDFTRVHLVSPELNVIMKTKSNAFKSISFIFYRCMGLSLIERKGMHNAEVYMYLEENVIFIYQLPPPPPPKKKENKVQMVYSRPSFIRKLFALMHYKLVEKLSDQFKVVDSSEDFCKVPL